MPSDSTSSTDKPSIGLIGSGPVARALADVLQRVGYSCVVSSRTPQSEPSRGGRVVSFEEAARADVVIFAVLHTAVRALTIQLRQALVGKVVIDVDNAWLPGHAEAAGLVPGLTEGEWFARLLPDSRVARAFSHINWTRFSDGLHRPGYWGAGYAADDVATSALIGTILSDVGFVPVKVGSLDESASLDAGGALWSSLLPAAETRRAASVTP